MYGLGKLEGENPYELRPRDYTYRGVWAKTHPWSSTTGRPVPSVIWQRQEYFRVMGQEPPEGFDPQFQYNPRTKAGKALREALIAASEGSDG